MKNTVRYRFRSITDLTDEEISNIVTSLYECMITEIYKNKSNDTITVYATSDWNGQIMEDTITLEYDSIWSHDFSFSSDEIWKYRQYLFALGVNLLAKDNQFLSL